MSIVFVFCFLLFAFCFLFWFFNFVLSVLFVCLLAFAVGFCKLSFLSSQGGIYLEPRRNLRKKELETGKKN